MSRKGVFRVWSVLDDHGRYQILRRNLKIREKRKRMHVDEEDCEMSTPAQRIEVFQDTMDWIKSDSVLSTSIPVAKKNTTVFYEDDIDL